MPVTILFCYAREDEALLNRLKAHLRPLQRQGLIEVWYDRDINAGAEWEQEIKQHLNTAQIILLLVSPDFMDSDYCYSVEMSRALERHERGEVTVIPIILRPAYWHGEPLGKLQALPKDGKAVTTWANQDVALYDITQGVYEVVIRLTTSTTSVLSVVAEAMSQQVVQADSITHSAQQESKVPFASQNIEQHMQLVATESSINEHIKDTAHQPELSLMMARLLVYRGHTEGYNSGVWSSDGVHFALGGASGLVQVYDARTNALLWSTEEHIGSISGLAWSPDGSRLASGAHDKTVRIWEASSGRVLSTYTNHIGWIGGLAWSPDGNRLVSSDHKTVQVWKASSGQVLHTIYTANGPAELAWSPDGKWLASNGSPGGEIQVWGEAISRRVLNTDYRDDYDRGDSPSWMTMLLSWTDVLVWPVLAWSLNGKWLAVGLPSSTIQLWEVSSGRMLCSYIGHKDMVTALAWSPDGKCLASGSKDKTIRVWEANSGRMLHTYTGPTDLVRVLAWSPDGKWLAAGLRDKAVYVWEVNKRRIICLPVNLYVRKLMWSPDGKWLASGSDSGTVQVWEASTGQILSAYNSADSVKMLAWSPDGKWLAAGLRDKTVHVWEASTGLMLYTHSQPVEALAWSPDGKWLAVGSWDKTVVWEASSGRMPYTYTGQKASVEALAWSPDGKWLACGDGETVQVWEASSGRTLHTYTGHTSWISVLAWSPDGKCLASGSKDKTVVWEASSGRMLHTYTGHTDPVKA